MKEIVTIVSTAEVKNVLSFADFIEMRVKRLLEELKQNSLEIEKLTNKLIETISNNRH